VIVREFGGPDVLRVEEVPTPVPGENEVLVRVHAVSINRSFDLSIRENKGGYNPVLPWVPGVDPSGEVAAVGTGVDPARLGQRVTIRPYVSCGSCDACRQGLICRRRQMIGVHRWGGSAELVCVPVTNLVPLPDGLSFGEATVAGRHFPTAFGLTRKANLQAGQTVLIMGAVGALGSCAVQVAKSLGATVIAAAGTDERAAAAISLGADHGINYRAADLEREVMRLTDDRGVDAVFENIGDPTLWPGAVNSLTMGGILVTVGSHGGENVALDVRRLYGRRLTLASGLGAERAEDLPESLAQVANGTLRVLIDRTLPLEQAAEAHRLVEESQALGKVILDPTLV